MAASEIVGKKKRLAPNHSQIQSMADLISIESICIGWHILRKMYEQEVEKMWKRMGEGE